MTRYPLVGYRPVKLSAAYAAFAVVFFVGGTVAMATLLYGLPLGRVLVLAAVCTLIGPATFLLPRWWLSVAVIVVVGVGTLAWATSGGRFSGGYAWCWLGTTVCGVLLLNALVYRRWWRRRLAGAEGAPPSGQDPSQEGVVDFLARWKDAGHEYETAVADLDVVLDAVRALNGNDRSVVSVYRGKGRLDVGGDADGLMIVQQSDDRRNWHQAIDPSVPEKPADLQAVVYSGIALRYPRRVLVRIPDAETAVRAWVGQGERAGSLSWWSDSGLAPVTRPRSLRNSD